MAGKLKYLILILLSITLVFCHKPRNGEYYLTQTGTKFINSCSGPNCTTSNEAVSTKSVVLVEDSKKYTLYVDGKRWTKDINTVSYSETFTNNYSSTKTESFKFEYSGAIKSKTLIEGTYTITSVYTEEPLVVSATNTGYFTLREK